MNSSANATKGLVELLDASPWVNVLRCVISLNAVATNAFLLYLFAKCPNLRNLQCNWLIALNAAIETVIGFGMCARGLFEMYVAASGVPLYSHALCVWLGSPLTGGFASNQITIMALAVDRVRAVVRPLSFGSQNTAFLCASVFLTFFIFCTAIWVSAYRVDYGIPSTQCSMAVNAGPLFPTVWPIYAQSSTLIVFAIYALLIWMLYTRTSQIQHERQRPEKIVQQMIVQQRVTASVALILAVYSFCWALPTAVWFILNFLDPTNRARLTYVTFAQGLLTTSGAGVNLYIYLFKHAEIRSCAFKIAPFLKRILRKKHTVQKSTSNQMGANSGANTATNVAQQQQLEQQKPLAIVG